ncbi:MULTISPECIES: glutamate racemase [Duncaniella]|jgi:glutamate racemase|uniref:glutamate racemase n=1 Tax=Duncaniella TaxID=2518495 RepID=UPI000B26080D|nr:MULTISPECIES: glutamate racemase [Duncaniella]NBH92280.1 glutamate racemase [Muribaculaceae bacterium S4]NBI20737.1 glutamate racemase [Muribaculaceae bacterium Z1]ROS87113.1 glutamate racemase [Muribaculaceae bacterium Isolate-039 (Harlan)]ROT00267.1 glutamate racemase [Muribaculaceae bacterium Isolate-083 (Janvier)]ROT00360.1 glutamate racemase [Muribaculaceae bacterium Isolate-077 (Janvier)]ROT02665.1 glutamate racemase [Muribaculaceae bacterium Isolate-084 (Janvier)]GFI51772.1 glutama
MFPSAPGPIGVFDSGYGGLTILKGIRETLPQYDYLYLGDNARTPYGTRSFDVVYRFTRQAVEALFSRGCQLVILACNTASAKALRSIQQKDLPGWDPSRRVLGVVIPTVEALGHITKNGNIGLLGTPGTVSSGTYDIEIAKFFPQFRTVSVACPMWVPLVENKEFDSPGADYFVKKYVDELFTQEPEIDTVILGCTHYPLLIDKIRREIGSRATIVTQGELVGASLADYLRRHPEMDAKCTKGGSCEFLTTENPDKFTELAEIFLQTPLKASRIDL